MVRLNRISDLTDHTGFWMRMVSNAVSHEFSRRIATEGVTVAEWCMLRMLHDVQPTSPSIVAKRMGMTNGAISKLADRLVSKGLVEKIENLNDKRAHSLSLTSDGRAKVPALASIADLNDADFFDVLTTDEQETLSQLLRALADRRGLTITPVD